MKTEDRREKKEERRKEKGKERNKPETREKDRHTASKFTSLEKNKTKNKKTSDVLPLFRCVLLSFLLDNYYYFDILRNNEKL